MGISIERNKELYAKYGSWVLFNRFDYDKLKERENKFEISVLDLLPTGWAKAFGMELIDELGKAVDEAGMRETYIVEDIKEKFGSLRWYDSFHTARMTRVLAKYEVISSAVCIHCGRPDVGTTNGYIIPICESCYRKFPGMEDKSAKYIHSDYIKNVGPYNLIERRENGEYSFYNRIPNEYKRVRYGLDCSFVQFYDITETADMIREKWNRFHPYDTTPLSKDIKLPQPKIRAEMEI